MSLFGECAVGAAVGWMSCLVEDGSFVHVNLSSEILVALVPRCDLEMAFLINLKCHGLFDW